MSLLKMLMGKISSIITVIRILDGSNSLLTMGKIAFILNWGSGAREMLQWLRALTAVLEDLGSIPRIHVVVQTICNSGSRGHSNLF